MASRMADEKEKALPGIRAMVVKDRAGIIEKADVAVQLPPEDEANAGDWILPPVDMRGYKSLVNNSSILPQCIRAYKNNICGYGIGVRYVDDAEETPEMAEEFNRASEIIELLCTEQDTKEVFEDVIEARETYGIAYIEVIRNLAGEVVQIEFVRDTPSVWKTKPLDPYIDTPFWHHGTETVRKKRYCKYRQEVGGKTVYFKEFGDPRVMDRRSGEYLEEGEEIDLEWQANEIMEFAIGTEPYGEVRWIGQVLGVDGSRRAEELNNNYFRNGRHTPLMIMIHGGSLTDDSYSKLQEYMDDIKGENGQHAFIILETETTDGRVDFDSEKQPTVEIKELAGILQKDELFQGYLDSNRRRAQSAFQLPDLYVGYTTDFNRATAQTAQEVTEEQVFQPERKSLAWAINNRLLNGYNFKYVEAYFMAPDISNPDDQYRLLMAANEAGGVTPNFAKKVLYEAYGEVSEDYPDGWGDMPLVYTQMQAEKEAREQAEEQQRLQLEQLNGESEEQEEGEEESGEVLEEDGEAEGPGYGEIEEQLGGQIEKAESNGDGDVAGLLEKVRDQLREIINAEFNEADHPRDERGRFVKKPGGGDAGQHSESDSDGGSWPLKREDIPIEDEFDLARIGNGADLDCENGKSYHKAGDGQWYTLDKESHSYRKIEYDELDEILAAKPVMKGDFFDKTFLMHGMDYMSVSETREAYENMPEEMKGAYEEVWSDPKRFHVALEGGGTRHVPDRTGRGQDYIVVDLYDSAGPHAIIHESSHAIDDRCSIRQGGAGPLSASGYIDTLMDEDGPGKKSREDFAAMASRIGLKPGTDNPAGFFHRMSPKDQLENAKKYKEFMKDIAPSLGSDDSLSCISDAISGMTHDLLGESMSFGGHDTEYWEQNSNGGSYQAKEYWANYCYMRAVKDGPGLDALKSVSPNMYDAASQAYDQVFKKKQADVRKADDGPEDGHGRADSLSDSDAAKELEDDIGKTLGDQVRKIARAIKDSKSVIEFAGTMWPDIRDGDGSDRDIADAFLRLLKRYVPAMADRMIRESDPGLRLERLSKRMSAWMHDWSRELGRLMKLGTHEKVESVLSRGIEEGAGVEDVARRLQSEGIRDTRARARRAARTEILTANRAAQQEAFMQSPSVEKKSWLHSGTYRNGNPRLNHMAISGQTVPKDQPFRLLGRDGEIYHPMYPGDTSLPASERVNCGCVCQPVVSERVLGLPLEERKRLQEQAVAEMDDEWERELDAQNKARAGISEEE